MARPLIAILSAIFLAGAIVIQFFLILSGGVKSAPETHVYFLQASTNGIPNAPNPARWTYWSICGVNQANGLNADCGKSHAALPFAPSNRHNFGTETGVPVDFYKNHYYYFMSRFAWVFFLIALLFSVFAFLTCGLALCTRIGAYLSGFLTLIAFAWQALAAALMTAWTVQARNVWQHNGHDANLGKYAYGFAWAPVALLLLASIEFCSAGGRSRRAVRKEYV